MTPLERIDEIVKELKRLQEIWKKEDEEMKKEKLE